MPIRAGITFKVYEWSQIDLHWGADAVAGWPEERLGNSGSLAGLKPHSQHVCSASLFAKVTVGKVKNKNQNKTLDLKYIEF